MLSNKKKTMHKGQKHALNNFVNKSFEKTQKFRNETILNLRKQAGLDNNIDLFKLLDINKINVIFIYNLKFITFLNNKLSDEAFEPTVAYYFDRIYDQMNNNDIDEGDKVKKDQVMIKIFLN